MKYVLSKYTPLIAPLFDEKENEFRLFKNIFLNSKRFLSIFKEFKVLELVALIFS